MHGSFFYYKGPPLYTDLGALKVGGFQCTADFETLVARRVGKSAPHHVTVRITHYNQDKKVFLLKMA